MKRRLLSLILVFIVCSTCLFACSNNEEPTVNKNNLKYKYSYQEHVRNIRAITEEIYSEEIENDLIANIEVDLMYPLNKGLDEVPTFFVIDIEYKEEKEYIISNSGEEKSVITKFNHYLGYIDFDEYRSISIFYNDCFQPGKSICKALNVSGNKKYFTSQTSTAYCTFAVEIDNKIITIFNINHKTNDDWRIIFNNDEQCYERVEYTEKMRKRLDGYTVDYYPTGEFSQVESGNYKYIRDWV